MDIDEATQKRIKEGGPAFPPTMRGLDQYHEGLRVQDWFAGMALNGLLANASLRETPEKVAEMAYAIANATVKERCK